MNTKMNEFMNWAKESGWTITKNPAINVYLSGSFIARYKEIPNEYLDFLVL